MSVDYQQVWISSSLTPLSEKSINALEGIDWEEPIYAEKMAEENEYRLRNGSLLSGEYEYDDLVRCHLIGDRHYVVELKDGPESVTYSDGRFMCD